MATFEIKKKITVKTKYNPDLFGIANNSFLSDTSLKFGSSRSAVTAMLTNPELMELIMPTLVNSNPNDLGWQKAISDYWDGLYVEIKKNGTDLEVGFTFNDMDSNKIREPYIKKLKLDKKLNTAEEIGKYVMSYVPFEEHYRYGVPLNIRDYAVYIYSKGYRDVANNVNDVNNSGHIRFYIHDDTQVKRNQEVKMDSVMKAHDKYMELITMKDADDRIHDILIVLDPSNITEVRNMSAKERKYLLHTEFNKDADAFLKVYDDKSLTDKAHIERLIDANIIQRLTNSSIITDKLEPAIVIGNTTDEAITWFNNDINKPKITEYNNKFKAIK